MFSAVISTVNTRVNELLNTTPLESHGLPKEQLESQLGQEFNDSVYRLWMEVHSPFVGGSLKRQPAYTWRSGPESQFCGVSHASPHVIKVSAQLRAKEECRGENRAVHMLLTRVTHRHTTVNLRDIRKYERRNRDILPGSVNE